MTRIKNKNLKKAYPINKRQTPQSRLSYLKNGVDDDDTGGDETQHDEGLDDVGVGVVVGGVDQHTGEQQAEYHGGEQREVNEARHDGVVRLERGDHVVEVVQLSTPPLVRHLQPDHRHGLCVRFIRRCPN